MPAKASSRVESKKHRGVFEKEPGSGIWWIRYFADGKIKREKVGRKSDAIALYQKRKSDARAGVKLPDNLRKKTDTLSVVIDRALEWYAAHRPKQLYDASIHLEAWRKGLGERTAIVLTPTHIDNWISGHEDWSPATMNRYKATLGRALQLEVIAGRLDRNVARLVVARREYNLRIRWLKPDEETRLYQNLSPGLTLAVDIARNTGLRRGEQFNLEWSAVDFDRKRILLEKTKNGSDREVPLNSKVIAALRKLYQSRSETNNRVFQSTRYDAALCNPRKAFSTACEKAGVTDLHWHDLRHDFCSQLVMRGVDIHTVSKLAGHSSIEITAKRYAHLSPEHLANAVDVLV